MNAEGLVAAAHELKMPLALMRQLAVELEGCDDAGRRAEIIKRMRLTAERSLRLTDNLTRLARLEDAMFELEPIQINGLIYEVVDELTPLTKALQQTFRVRIGSRLLAVGHRELLSSLLVGLVDNALQAGRSGQRVDISAGLRRGEMVVAVRDHGAILDIVEYRRLATALGQQVTPLASRPQNSGLGIMIAERLVRAMHGRLSVSRHHDGGATFRAHLPVSAQLSLLEA